MPFTPRVKRRSISPQRDNVSSTSGQTRVKTQNSSAQTSVQDRIRQWQAQGAANALAPDSLSVRSLPLSDQASEISGPRSRSEYVTKPITLRTNALRKEREKKDVEEEPRDRGAPRKRVISDGHWRARREAKNNNIDSRSPQKQREQGSGLDLSYTSNNVKQHLDDDLNQQKRSRHSQERRQKDNFKPEQSSRIHKESKPFVSDDGRFDDNLARRLSYSPSYRSDHGSPNDHPPAYDEQDETYYERSRYAEALGRPNLDEMDEHGQGLKRKKGRIMGKTKDMFSKTDSAPPISHRLPSIEAWLYEQPDPFMDDQVQFNPIQRLDAEHPQPRSEHRRKKSKDTPVVDPNNIWQSISPPSDPLVAKDAVSGSRRRRRSTRNDLTPKEEPVANANVNDLSEGSGSGLRRRGARTRRAHKTQSPVTGHRNIQNRDLPPLPSAAATQPLINDTLAEIVSARAQTSANTPADHQDDQNSGCDLKRKLTTHEDLMSVLSLPNTGRRIRSARSLKGSRRRASEKSILELLQSLKVDEEKYSRELRTLVDGVIPVLLQCVLSKSNSIAAAGLFTSTDAAQDDMSFAKPIIDMGIALERLKSLHNRIPVQSADSLLAWSQTACKAYADYLKAWRLGFQDVVVNLAPLNHDQAELDQGMSRDADGDVVDSEGKKVDVAYLLKRPVVRVKNLGKMFESIKGQLGTTFAVDAAQKYADLTKLARRRYQEEQARLEDRAAAVLDSTRARDIRSMAVTTGVRIDQSRRVKARDTFNLTLYHSTGQRIDCRVEIVLRDSQVGTDPGGDVLICEVDDTGKWLLFPPAELSTISARRGEDGFDLIIMIRGPSGIGREWQELLALKTDDPEAAGEWLAMLGSNPLPPKLNRSGTISKNDPETKPILSTSSEEGSRRTLVIGGLPAQEMDIPIGEPSVISKPTSHAASQQKSVIEHYLPRLNLGGGLQSKPKKQQLPLFTDSKQKSAVSSVLSWNQSIPSEGSSASITKQIKPSSAPTTPIHHSPQSKQEGSMNVHSSGHAETGSPDRPHRHGVLTKKPIVIQSPVDSAISTPQPPQHGIPPADLPYSSTISSTPSQGLPTVNKVRGVVPKEKSRPSTSLNESIHEKWQALSISTKSQKVGSEKKVPTRNQIYTEDLPSPPTPTKQSNSSPDGTSGAHRTSNQIGLRDRELAVLQPKSSNLPGPEPKLQTEQNKDTKRSRRSSSPLKHEYAPSSASNSKSEYDTESVSDSSSETSDDFGSENDDMPTPLVAVRAGDRRTSKSAIPPSIGIPSTGTRTLGPSDSASQGPYRKVPSSGNLPGKKQARMIALVCSWSDRAVWEPIYPDECSIVISPGLIEAFEMSAAHSGPSKMLAANQSHEGSESRTSSPIQQPLVAFELTPIVPLRKGTALDISIRSPPTPHSKIKTTSNVMFRSRNPEECEALYTMINWARCNNPTYIQLEKARPRQPSVTFNLGEEERGRSKSGSWFSFGGSQKKSSYRATSAPIPASPSVGGSDASAGTTNSAFSALKRFGTSSAFNLNRSSVLRKGGIGRGGGSLYSSSTGTRTGSGSSTPVPSQIGLVPGKDGPNVPETSAAAANGGGMINNMKIRLYLRKGQQWENLGAARLKVLPAPGTTPGTGSGGATPTKPNGSGPSSPSTVPANRPVSTIVGKPGEQRTPRLPSSSHTPHRIHGNGREKRVLVTKNKSNDIILLDAVLGESCFERIMQTGIAVKVWTEDESIGHTGGVLTGRERIYMMQFPGTKEAGWVFQMCGTYRYGD